MYNTIDQILQFANNIFTTLGTGHTESIYHRAMEAELRSNGIGYESEVVTPIKYKDTYVGYGRADIVVNKELIVELKAIASDFKYGDRAKVKTYMNSLGLQHGIMINFPQNDQKKCNILVIEP